MIELDMTIECTYCTEPITLDSAVDRDDDGNIYHYDCAVELRTKWVDAGQEILAEEGDP